MKKERVWQGGEDFYIQNRMKALFPKNDVVIGAGQIRNKTDHR